jgi:hypothetical protein
LKFRSGELQIPMLPNPMIYLDYNDIVE